MECQRSDPEPLLPLLRKPWPVVQFASRVPEEGPEGKDFKSHPALVGSLRRERHAAQGKKVDGETCGLPAVADGRDERRAPRRAVGQATVEGLDIAALDERGERLHVVIGVVRARGVEHVVHEPELGVLANVVFHVVVSTGPLLRLAMQPGGLGRLSLALKLQLPVLGPDRRGRLPGKAKHNVGE